MGIYMMNRGLMPIGALIAGVLGAALGVQAAIAAVGVLTFVSIAVITVLQRGAWRQVDAAIAMGAGREAAGAVAEAQPSRRLPEGTGMAPAAEPVPTSLPSGASP
jgi:hypothetical protein